MHTRSQFAVLILTGVAALGGCVKPIDDQADTTAAGATAARGGEVVTTAPDTMPAIDAAMRIEVDLTARKLYVFRDGAPVDTHSVAVGSREWPTQTGTWRIIQVVFNPEWTPPDEEWAKDEKPEKPGDPDNPLGRAQLVYDPPRSIHGTNQPGSIGKAVSHGSIRMTNAAIVELATQVMEAAGVPHEESWFQAVQRNRTTKEIVDLPNPVPIIVR